LTREQMLTEQKVLRYEARMIGMYVAGVLPAAAEAGV
jgi:hypothetical protein